MKKYTIHWPKEHSAVLKPGTRVRGTNGVEGTGKIIKRSGKGYWISSDDDGERVWVPMNNVARQNPSVKKRKHRRK